MDAMHPRKKILLQEAARLFREKSFEVATLRELAKCAGIKGGSVYYHFSSKQEILFCIMHYTLTELTSQLEEALKTESDPEKKLHKAIEIHVNYHIKNKDMTYVTDSEIRSLTAEQHYNIIEKRKKYENLFSGIVDKITQANDQKGLNSKLSTFAILQMCTGVSYWYNDNGPLGVEDIVKAYFNLSCRGLQGNDNVG
ncbi:MAG: TetR/AcrR family transcriptional regulator [Syntrophales bacterium]|jgi:AcrR family transcriptional regulator|nr:TetR/AcrR family transcriptional regulator [Syntrophales bacterium]MCK9528694.1 TetR/AcrR family transcriptional regulator [Syntrophales bacterium]MDX9922647.1 TetR/AcrR family transcriptional regulator [Syntrophales bacterium]